MTQHLPGYTYSRPTSHQTSTRYTNNDQLNPTRQMDGQIHMKEKYKQKQFNVKSIIKTIIVASRIRIVFATSEFVSRHVFWAHGALGALEFALPSLEWLCKHDAPCLKCKHKDFVVEMETSFRLRWIWRQINKTKNGSVEFVCLFGHSNVYRVSIEFEFFRCDD